MHWFAMVIPIASAVILYWKFRERAVWWEFLVIFAFTAALIFGFKLTAETMQTTDTEYWGGWIREAEYYEDWDEEVPCRHDKYETYTDSKGRTQRRYIGKEHPYDVDYHPPYWQALESNGETISIDRSKFEELANKFGNRRFVDLHRHYHSNDGDKYVAVWLRNDEAFEPAVTKHSYENRIQAGNSVFNFPDVEKAKVKANGLFDYPKISGFYNCPSVLGNGGPAYYEALNKLDFWNAKLGAKKEVRMMILVFMNRPMDSGFLQEQYWKGGNKNEFIICIGVDNDYNIQWCHTFSWTKVEELKVEARSFVMGFEKLDLVKVVDWLVPEVDSKFARRHFSEFSYINVEPPMWSVVLIYFITIALNIGMAAWIVKNKYSEDSPVFKRKSSFPRISPFIRRSSKIW
jgi:hypothetical protein